MRVLAALGCIACLGSAAAGSAGLEPTSRVLWRDPGPLGQKDLYWGAGSADRAPKPPFTFVAEDVSGTSPKIKLKDAAGAAWTAKFATSRSTGNEVHAEIAASRIVWAFGYVVDEHYFVPNGFIRGASGLERAAASVGPDGRFRSARFEREPANVERIGRWDLADNPFLGSRELSGLTILVMLLNNWDARSGNTAILRVPQRGDRVEEHYLLSDLGTAFGRMDDGMFRKHSRWNLAHYASGRLVHAVAVDRLEFHHPLNGRRVAVPLAHAQWFVGLADQIRPEQLRSAFKASGAGSQEAEAFAKVLLARLAELRAAVTAKR